MSEPETFASVPRGDFIRSGMVRMWLVAALGKGGGQVIQLISLAILARLLVPADFGVIAMVMAVIGVAGIFSDMGLSAATIRAKHITEGQASALLLLNISFGLLVSVAVFLLVPLLTGLYDDPRTLKLGQMLAWSFVLNSLGTQHLALLRRQLKFSLLAKMNVASIFVGQLVAIAMAVGGWEYWSLAVAMLVTSALRVMFAWWFNPWRPGKPEGGRELRAMIGFGGYLVVFALMGYAALNVHNVILGWRYSAEDVGFYTRAFAILALLVGYVTAPLDAVAPAALARMTDDPESYRETYIHTVRTMLLLAAPIGFVCLVGANDIVAIILGDQWQAAVVVLQLLALSVVPRVICNSSGWLYQSHGDSRSMMQWGVGGWGVLILLQVIGVQYGVQGVAAAYSIGMFILLYPCMKLAFRRSTICMRDLKGGLPIVAAAMLSSVIMYLFSEILEDCLPGVRMVLLLLIFGGSYLALLIAFRQKPLLNELIEQITSRTSAKVVQS